MLGYNELALPMRKVATALFASSCAILANAASAQMVQVGSVQGVEGNSQIPLDVTRAYSFENETCDNAKVAHCSKATIFVFSEPLIEMSNVAAAASRPAKFAAGSTLTYLVTVTNSGPGSAGNIKLVEAPRAGVNCPDRGAISAIGGSALPNGNFTIADLTGPGIPLTSLQLGQSTTLTYSCQVN